MLRRLPSVSATTPKTTPSVMPASCTSESRKPACTSVRPSASRSTGIAGGSLPMCSAATTPARITSKAGSRRRAAAVDMACEYRQAIHRSCSMPCRLPAAFFGRLGARRLLSSPAMTFLWPTCLWLLPALPLLPLLYAWLLRRRGKPALRYSGLALVREAAGRTSWRRHVPPALLWLACAMLLFAAARPTAKLTLPWARTSIMLAIDVSLSMRVQRRQADAHWRRRRRRPSSSCATCRRASRSGSSPSRAAHRSPRRRRSTAARWSARSTPSRCSTARRSAARSWCAWRSCSPNRASASAT